ncbi:hypothetical protein HMN09_00139900 [Mycena chlorophos]|uniref:Uncharacterized protein n=1 Tax=Mycena chlorophos TaxID=658473 RepID=A0A8H6WQ83_MYCCL|nr:hypothetical protein HMN09_00139900 [Mycena chlorophos]
MTRRIAVDDASSQISYGASGWSVADAATLNAMGNYGPIFEDTSHATTTDGSTFTFDFTGTTVDVMGTIAVKKLADGTYDPTWTCTVDGAAISQPNPTFAYPENNWSLCSSSSLSGGAHTLKVTVSTKGTAFYFDNIFYTPTVDATTIDGAVLEYLNTDGAVSFGGSGWVPWGAQNVTQGSGATVSLNFRGTAVTLLAYVPQELPHTATTAKYSIDNGAATTFTLAGLASGSTTTVYNVVIMQTDGLSADEHSLVVTYEGSSSDTPLPVGAFYVTNSVAPATTAATQPGTTSSSGGTTSGPASSSKASVAGGAPVTGTVSNEGDTNTLTGTNPANPSGTFASTGNSGSAQEDTSATTTSSKPTAAIAGGVVAALLVLAVLAGLLFWCRKRRSRQRAEDALANQARPFTDGMGMAGPGGASFAGSSSIGHEGIPPSQRYANAAYFPGAEYPYSDHPHTSTSLPDNHPSNPFNTPPATASAFTSTHALLGAGAGAAVNNFANFSYPSPPPPPPHVSYASSGSHYPTTTAAAATELAYARGSYAAHSRDPSLTLTAVSATHTGSGSALGAASNADSDPSTQRTQSSRRSLFSVVNGEPGYGEPGYGDAYGASSSSQAPPLPSKLSPNRPEPQVIVQQHQDSGVRYNAEGHVQQRVVVEELPPGYSAQ